MSSYFSWASVSSLSSPNRAFAGVSLVSIADCLCCSVCFRNVLALSSSCETAITRSVRASVLVFALRRLFSCSSSRLYSATLFSISSRLHKTSSAAITMPCWAVMFASADAFFAFSLIILVLRLTILFAASSITESASFMLAARSSAAFFPSVSPSNAVCASEISAAISLSSFTPSSRIAVLSFNDRISRLASVALLNALEYISSYAPSPRMLPRIVIRASLSAVRNNPYWSCIINAVAFNVRLSIPMVFKISCCVSFIFSQLRSAHSPSANSARLSVAFPDFIRVRVTR